MLYLYSEPKVDMINATQIKQAITYVHILKKSIQK